MRYLMAIAMLLAGCSDVCSSGELGTGLDCPSDVASVSPSDEHLSACGEGPVLEAAESWGLTIGDRGARVEYAYPRYADWLGETTFVLEHNARGRIVAINGCTILTRSCDPLVLAHELGHCLGYPDVDDPGSVMHFALDGAGWRAP